MSFHRGTIRVALAFVLVPLLAGCTQASAPERTVLASPPQTEATLQTQPSQVPTEIASELAEARRLRREGDLDASLGRYRKLAATGQAPSESLFEMGEVEVAAGRPEAARETLQRLLHSDLPQQLLRRVELLLATAELAVGDWEAVLRRIDVGTVPDGLGDLVALRRAQALARGGDERAAAAELARPELKRSTNRPILEQAGAVAEEVGVPALAAELYARGAGFFGWTAERSRMVRAAGLAYERSGDRERAVAQFRSLVEVYGWTKAAEEGAAALERLGAMTAYHRGLLALAARRYEEARDAFRQAAAGGTYASAAAAQLRQLDDSDAWRAAVEDATVESYRRYLARSPAGARATEARFQEGFAHYEAGRPDLALAVWTSALEGGQGTGGGTREQAPPADERARLLLWSAKALKQLGRIDEAWSKLEAAAAVTPTGYYAVRARDLADGVLGWPTGGRELEPISTGELAEAERWIAGWSREKDPAPAAEECRVGRALGLLALGLRAEAEAELNGLIAETRDPSFLLRLAQTLADRQLWSPESRAAARLLALSPEWSVADSPAAVRKLLYPPGFWNLVSGESEARRVDPLLLAALIHQESRYDPYALSVSDARGLTQVIPGTGRAIAAALGRKRFELEELYRPSTAVQFGAWYLAEQLSDWGGDPFEALAAYNAGSAPVNRWATTDPDLFVERIDYSETRAYVRQVYLHHALYRRLLRPGP